ncbi:hypothetical protein F6X00_25445 (plasmid) [Vibrio vulnificus]|uniref:hypothetical protein n=1 Tax=Vibrio vulnificus TaxID=672 RepID=UPI0015F82675|nr:hypothetical protein [Vibrio vulnificus]QMV39742.1 hypothetical protein F6X00_25445 [Vibrio vulnificus]
MKIKVWPFGLVLMGLWFLTAVTIGYLLIGMVIKVGHGFFRDDGDSGGKLETPSSTDLMMDCYHVTTWPWYVQVVGIKESLQLITGGLFCLSTAFGMFYYLGASTNVPESVTNSYRSIVTERDHPLPLHVKAEINRRIDDGFEYSDLIWARDELIRSCGIDKEPVNVSTQLLSTAMMGIFRMFPIYSATLMSVGNTIDRVNCTINETTND